LAVVRTDSVLLHELVELPQQKGRHLLPPHVEGLRVYQGALALVHPELEGARQAGSRAGSDAGLTSHEEVVE